MTFVIAVKLNQLTRMFPEAVLINSKCRGLDRFPNYLAIYLCEPKHIKLWLLGILEYCCLVEKPKDRQKTKSKMVLKQRLRHHGSIMPKFMKKKSEEESIENSFVKDLRSLKRQLMENMRYWQEYESQELIAFHLI